MDFSLGDAIVSIFWFMLLLAWIWLLIAIVTDLFRDHETSGWAKAGWVLFLIVVPWLGALVYLIARGSSMNERAQRAAAVQDQQMRRFVRDSAAAPPSTADELSRLAQLHTDGHLSDEDYRRAKAQVLSTGTGTDTGSRPAGVVPPRQPA